MNIKKYGLMLTSKSQLKGMYRDDNLYGLLAEKLTTDYFELLRIKSFVQQVIDNKIDRYDINADNYGYCQIGPINTVLILENHYSDDFPEYMIRGYIPSLDIFKIISMVVSHIENNNWTPNRQKLKVLYDSITNFSHGEYEITLNKSEKSFGLYYNKNGDRTFKNLVQNYIMAGNRETVIKSNFSRYKGEEFIWISSNTELYYKFLRQGIDNELNWVEKY